MVDAIRDALGPVCTDLDVPADPELVHLHNITHLGTTIEGTLPPRTDGHRVPTALRPGGPAPPDAGGRGRAPGRRPST